METVLEGVNIDEKIEEMLAKLRPFWCPEIRDKDVIYLALQRFYVQTLDTFGPCRLDEIVKKTLAEADK